MEINKALAEKILLSTNDDEIKNIIFNAFPSIKLDMLLNEEIAYVDVYDYSKKKSLANILNDGWKRTINNEGFFFYKEKNYFVIGKHYSAVYDDVIYFRTKAIAEKVIKYMYGHDAKIHL